MTHAPPGAASAMYKQTTLETEDLTAHGGNTWPKKH